MQWFVFLHVITSLAVGTNLSSCH